MMWNFLVLFSIVSAPILTAVVKEVTVRCGDNEYTCEDGSCVGLALLCDGAINCPDGSDERACYIGPDNWEGNSFFARSKRQSRNCPRDKWQCKDGTCISFDGKCDGVVDCLDGSDETHALCRRSRCQSNWFRCTYGACVDGSALCNGVPECADSSDELHPTCRNSTDEIGGQFKCTNGQTIVAVNRCDGVADCSDGSDENVRACAGRTCQSYLFQCAYGACVDQGSDCNGEIDCADGSDESPDLCIGTTTGGGTGTGTRPTQTTRPVTQPPVTTDGCVLPSYPQHGRYTVVGRPGAKPGDYYPYANISVTCDEPYGLVTDSPYVACDRRNIQLPQCVKFCILNPHISVDYTCSVHANDNIGLRSCNLYERPGARAIANCRQPNYYLGETRTSKIMECISGSWDDLITCKPECGLSTPNAVVLVSGGKKTPLGKIPWHAGIYDKTNNNKQICGGSIVTNKWVISAAHCFWDETAPSPAENYAVAVGKVFRNWNDQTDEKQAQKFDVIKLIISTKYHDSEGNYQEDIALLELSAEVVFKTYIRPVCVDFSPTFEATQLEPGNKGIVAGWGLTSANSKESPELLDVELPFIDYSKCYNSVPIDFREVVGSDKICAGYEDGVAALCKGDSGGGLAFPYNDKGKIRYYLRGVVSASPPSQNDRCNVKTYIVLTSVSSKSTFITSYIDFNK